MHKPPEEPADGADWATAWFDMLSKSAAAMMPSASMACRRKLPVKSDRPN